MSTVNDKRQVIVRMTAEHKARIRAAAQRDGLSMSAYLTRAGLALANGAGSTLDAPADTPQAADAVAALVATGLTTDEARRRVCQALTAQPEATTEQLVALAFQGASEGASP